MMKRPDQVRDLLARRFLNSHRQWLAALNADDWPQDIALGVPTEQVALQQVDGVQAWVQQWQQWTGPGILIWGERRWRALGTQRVPERLRLTGPEDLATCAGELPRWQRAVARQQSLLARWPSLATVLHRHFAMLADYPEQDLQRLCHMLDWLLTHPQSGLYPRQIPVEGLDSKWLESRKSLIAELLGTLQGRTDGERDFYRITGLVAPPNLIRLRLLDPTLRAAFGGLDDISLPLGQLTEMPLNPRHVLIVENLQSGLALGDLPGTVAILGRGYSVDILGSIPWLHRADCCWYWGDIDTHGLVILGQARQQLAQLRSVMMDVETLMKHQTLWSHEAQTHGTLAPQGLDESELSLYLELKRNTWGDGVRLEQERIEWGEAWGCLQSMMSTVTDVQ